MKAVASFFCFLLITCGSLIFALESVARPSTRHHAKHDLERADARLNEIYKHLRSRMYTEGQRDHLRSTERAWLKFRDASAEFEASFYSDDSQKTEARTISMLTMTERRIVELQYLFNTKGELIPLLPLRPNP
jgi:uncharacterized protein YecT (DUF1311 family)